MFKLMTSNNITQLHLNFCICRKDIVGCHNINTKVPPICPNVFSNFRNMSSNPLNINTNVVNNVILYRYEKPWMYKIASGFAIFALIGCLTMADNVYLILCKDLFNSNIDWGVRVKEHFLPLAAILIGVLAGKKYINFFIFTMYIVFHRFFNEL